MTLPQGLDGTGVDCRRQSLAINAHGATCNTAKHVMSHCCEIIASKVYCIFDSIPGRDSRKGIII